MSKGFITVAQNNSTTDYVKLAYLLALTIKRTQSVYKDISVLVTKAADVPEEYRWAFDQIIELDVDYAADDEWKLANECQVYEYSPYDETMKIEADMIVNGDLYDWWQNLDSQKLMVPTNILSYRNEIGPYKNIYRETFDICKLMNTYSGFTYFEKSPEAEQFFNSLTNVFLNWWIVNRDRLNSLEKEPTTDVCYAIALEETLGTAGTLCDTHMTFVHMKTGVQPGLSFDSDWRNVYNYYFTDNLELIIGNVRQPQLIHYYQKDFVTDNLIKEFENDILS